jgi:hypothetical protein
VSNQLALEAAVDATVEFLSKAVKPVLIGGPKIRVAKAQKAFSQLADACGYPVCCRLISLKSQVLAYCACSLYINWFLTKSTEILLHVCKSHTTFYLILAHI